MKGRKTDTRSRFCSSRALEIRLRLEAEPTGINDRGKRADLSVVRLGGVVKITTSYRYAILGPLNLSLEIAEIRIGLQVGIVLADRQQAAQGSTEGILSLFVLRSCADLSGPSTDQSSPWWR